MEARPVEHLWYVAYGSNLVADRFAAYLNGSSATSIYGPHRPAPTTVPPLDTRCLWLDHALYFAGHSQRWTGAVAFVDPAPAPRGQGSCGRGYLIQLDHFTHVAAEENGATGCSWTPDWAIIIMRVGDCAALPVHSHGEPWRGKYNVALRLPDIDGTPALTLTTARDLGVGQPSTAYLQLIENGVRDSRLFADEEIAAYLDGALRRSR
ncbi:hypothetical protein HT102_01240 [Hoyosella sp. G463]|uniref:Histone deacetylase n=1 Tax=Lolliginicoccus lacisalsi TaxID=2742202 RepID=A0A927PKT1_9ACTN|nr:hypothetical protein [Lolliginicoccus lacisalsi]MBD8505114.1 hypothetical protein [Lolliginicoccus lacisalsi]